MARGLIVTTAMPAVSNSAMPSLPVIGILIGYFLCNGSRDLDGVGVRARPRALYRLRIESS